MKNHLVQKPAYNAWRFITGGLILLCLLYAASFSDQTTWGTPEAQAQGTVPLISMEKRDALIVDLNGNNQPNAGDRLRYTIVIINRDSRAAHSLLFTDTLDSNTALITSTVQAPLGTVSSGNGPMDQFVSVVFPTLNAQSSTTVSFEAQINTDLPIGLNKVTNQAILTGKNISPVHSDDPDTDDPGDATVTLLVPVPDLHATMSSTLVVDGNGNNIANPGDVVEYVVSITNRGRRAASTVTFEGLLDANTMLLHGSVTTTRGKVERGNEAGDSDVKIAMNILAAGNDTASIRFRATINALLAQDVTEISAEGTIQTPDFPTIYLASTIPAQPGPLPPTATPSPSPTPSPTPLPASLPRVTMRDYLFIDTDGNDRTSVDDVLVYEIIFYNDSAHDLTDVVIEATPDADTRLEAGTVQADAGTVITGNSAEDSALLVNIGSVTIGEQVTILFQVHINGTGQNGLLEVQATARIDDPNSANVITIFSDDPDTDEVADSTKTPVGARTGSPTQRTYLPLLQRQ